MEDYKKKIDMIVSITDKMKELESEKVRCLEDLKSYIIEKLKSKGLEFPFIHRVNMSKIIQVNNIEDVRDSFNSSIIINCRYYNIHPKTGKPTKVTGIINFYGVKGLYNAMVQSTKSSEDSSDDEPIDLSEYTF